MTRPHWSLSHPRIKYISYHWIDAKRAHQPSSCDMYLQRTVTQKKKKIQQQQWTKAKILQRAGTSAPGIPLLH